MVASRLVPNAAAPRDVRYAAASCGASLLAQYLPPGAQAAARTQGHGGLVRNAALVANTGVQPNVVRIVENLIPVARRGGQERRLDAQGSVVDESVLQTATSPSTASGSKAESPNERTKVGCPVLTKSLGPNFAAGIAAASSVPRPTLKRANTVPVGAAVNSIGPAALVRGQAVFGAGGQPEAAVSPTSPSGGEQAKASSPVARPAPAAITLPIPVKTYSQACAIPTLSPSQMPEAPGGPPKPVEQPVLKQFLKPAGAPNALGARAKRTASSRPTKYALDDQTQISMDVFTKMERLGKQARGAWGYGQYQQKVTADGTIVLRNMGC